MDPERFDRLARFAARGPSRRALLGALGGGALAALGGGGAAAARRGTGPGECARPLERCATAPCCGTAVCVGGVCVPAECGPCVVYHLIACDQGACRPQCASDRLPNFECDECVNACVAAACRAHCGLG